MPSKREVQSSEQSPLALKIAAASVLLFLHVPVLIILLYAFTTDEATYSFPPPSLTSKWFGVAWGRTDFWEALGLSLKVASVATLIALILGTLAAAAVYRSKFFGREAISFLLILPLALPGIVTGIALRSAIGLSNIPFSYWTIVVGHATFCVVVVYNNVLARLALWAFDGRGFDGSGGRWLTDLPARGAAAPGDGSAGRGDAGFRLIL